MSKPYFLNILNKGQTETPWCQFAQSDGSVLTEIQITLSPDPNRNNYSEMTVEEQITYCKIAMSLMLEKYSKVTYIDGSFECNSSGHIHFHGTLGLPERLNPTYHSIRIGKYLHSQVGRKNLNWWICCKVDRIEHQDKWSEYINKGPVEKWNGLQPKQMKSKRSILDYL